MQSSVMGQLRTHSFMLLALGTISWVVIVYWQSFARIVDLWSISDYQYGWLVLPICIYVLAKKRKELSISHWKPSALGLLSVTTLVLVWILANSVGIQVIEFVCATLLIAAAFWALAGTEAFRIAAFPLLLLVAAVPMGGFLVEPLMKITAAISSGLLKLTGIPYLRDNQFFFLPGGSFEVADVCSGLRYLLAGTMAAIAYAYVTYSDNYKRFIFVGIVAISLVIANGVRAFIVMAVASATEMRVFGGPDHIVFGMIMFALVFIAMIWIGEGFADQQINLADSSRTVRQHRANTSSWIVVASVVLLVSVGPLAGAKLLHSPPVPIAEIPIPKLGDCSESQTWNAQQGVPNFSNADYRIAEMYECPGHQLGVFVASYGVRQQGKEVASWKNRIWPNQWRQYADLSTVNVDQGGVSHTFRQVLIRLPEGWRMTWYWYQVGTRLTSSQYAVKFLETIQTLTRQPVESSIVVVTYVSSGENNESELRQKIEPMVMEMRSWNEQRVALGEQR